MKSDESAVSRKALPRTANKSGSASARRPTHHKAGTRSRAYDKATLYICNFLSKGWEVSALGMLAFIHDKYGLPLYMVGLLSTMFIVSQISVSFFAGRIAHAIHSRNVIFLSIVSSGFCWLVLLLPGNVPVLFLAYAFGGVSSGLFEPIGNSLVAKISAGKNRAQAIGDFAACGDMGRIAVIAGATALAGLLGVNAACAVLLASALAAFTLAGMFIPRGADDDGPAAREIPVRLRNLMQNRKFRLATAAGIADSFSSASLYIFIPFLLTAKGIALANTLYFNVIFFAGYLCGRLALGRLADRHGAPQILMVSKAAMAGLIVLLTLLDSRTMIIGLLFLLGIFTRGSSPIIRAMVADAMDERTSFHNAFSAYSFASRSSSALCRPIYGFLASFAGISTVFYAASAVSLLTLYPAAQYRKGQPQVPADDADRRAGIESARRGKPTQDPGEVAV